MSSTILNLSARTTPDGTESMVLATSGTNWKAQLGSTTFVYGGVVVGTSATGMITVQGSVPTLETVATTNSKYDVATVSYNTSGGIGGWFFGYSRNATVNTQGAVNSGDQTGGFVFAGSDGTAFRTTAQILTFADAAPANSTTPGRISFQTTPVGTSQTPLERIRIDSSGNVNIGNQGATLTDVFSVSPQFQVSAAQSLSVNFRRYTADANSAYISFAKSRGAAIGTNTAVQSGDGLGYIDGTGWDATGTPVLREAAAIQFTADTAPTAGSVPGRLQFYTWNSSNTQVEALRIDSNQAAYLPGITTTASAANAFINNASSPANSILRSTSSLRYKDEVTPVPQSRLDAIASLQPIEFRSLSPADDKAKRFVGFAAEDVAAIDSALVNLDSEGRPDGVQYERVLLLQIEALRREIAELKEKLRFAQP